MKQIEFFKPPDVFEQTGEHHHRLDLSVNGEKIGFAEFDYFSNPFPFYYVSLIFLRKQRRGEGWGKEILVTINNYLDKTGKAGLLLNAIDEDSPAKSMYGNHGWNQVPGKPRWYYYNVSQKLGMGRLEKAVHTVDEAYKQTEEKPKAA